MEFPSNPGIITIIVPTRGSKKPVGRRRANSIFLGGRIHFFFCNLLFKPFLQKLFRKQMVCGDLHNCKEENHYHLIDKNFLNLRDSDRAQPTNCKAKELLCAPNANTKNASSSYHSCDVAIAEETVKLDAVAGSTPKDKKKEENCRNRKAFSVHAC